MQNQINHVNYSLKASEFNWQIAPGKTIKAWGFNNELAPVLRAFKGNTLSIKVKNNLIQNTVIHWHGIRLPASMDGTGEVQKPIQPGEEFEYRFVVPDAGTFWFHSHHNETEQMERGMYGALIVEDKSDPVVDAEKVFMIDDMKLSETNEFTKPSWFIPRIIERHDGRQGETLLVNGKENPGVEIHAGQIERWRFINSSSARYFLLYMQGREFKIIGTDGGLLEVPRTVTELLITPGERYDIVVGPFKEGETFDIESLSYNRTTFLKAKCETFAMVKVTESKPSIAFIPNVLRTIEPLASPNAPVKRTIRLSVGPSLKHGIDFLVNGQAHVNDKPVKVGELQVWEISNTSLMDHPFHLHGFFFQVIEVNGKAPEYMVWKDTYNLTPRTKIKIAWMPDNRPGMWMYHCHILEHHAAGMMANFRVIEGTENEDVSMPAHHSH